MIWQFEFQVIVQEGDDLHLKYVEIMSRASGRIIFRVGLGDLHSCHVVTQEYLGKLLSFEIQRLLNEGRKKNG